MHVTQLHTYICIYLLDIYHTTGTVIFELGVHKVYLALLTSELAIEGSIKSVLSLSLGITKGRMIILQTGNLLPVTFDIQNFSRIF